MIFFFKRFTFLPTCLIVFTLQLQAGVLHDLVNNNDFNGIASFVEKNGKADIDVADINGKSPLVIACQKRYFEIAWLLVKNGANVNHAGTQSTPLLIACSGIENFEQENEYAKFLVKNGATINIQFTDNNFINFTPFLAACARQNYELAKFLIENGAHIDATFSKKNANGAITDTNLAAICIACVAKDIEFVKFLVEHGANVNTKSSTPFFIDGTPLLIACTANNTELAKFLIENGANVNATFSRKNANGAITDTNLTALFIACTNKNIELAKFLVKKGAHINAESATPFFINGTPLLVACTSNNTELAKFLIENGANINTKSTSIENIHGRTRTDIATPLSEACKNKNTDIIKLLVKQNNPILASHGLFIACKLNDIELAKIFLNYGAHVDTPIYTHVYTHEMRNIVKKTLLTPLLITCSHKNPDFNLIALLIKHGANTNISVSEDLSRTSELSKLKKGVTAFSFIQTNWSQQLRKFFVTLFPFKEKFGINDIKIFMQLIFGNLIMKRSFTPQIFKFSNTQQFPKIEVENTKELVSITEDFTNTYFGEKPLPHCLPRNPFSLKTDKICNTICTTTPFKLWLKLNFNMTMEQYEVMHNFFTLAHTIHTPEELIYKPNELTYMPEELSLNVQKKYKELHDIIIKFSLRKKGTKRKFSEYKNS